MGTNKELILIVEDELTICNFIATTLLAHDYRVIKCNTGSDALSLVTSHCPDLILLDLGLPDMDGNTIIKEIRNWSSLPIIIISARIEEKDKVQALDLGADDYITKPFGTKELLARIRTALRHHNFNTNKTSCHQYKVKDLLIDFDKRMVFVDQKEVHLTQIEYKIITLLANHAGKVLTYDFLLTNIWGPYSTNDNQILRVNMANIRRKIEKNPGDPKYIFTEVGIGYRMVYDDM